MLPHLSGSASNVEEPCLQEKGDQIRASMSEEGHYDMLDTLGLITRASPEERPPGASQFVNFCIAQVSIRQAPHALYLSAGGY